MAGWGISPSPAISLLVSITTTRFCRSSASTRAISRRAVVLPTPGRPISNRDCPPSSRSRTMATVPNTARPTRQVRPTTSPRRLRIALMRCRVRSMPARLSAPNASQTAHHQPPDPPDSDKRSPAPWHGRDNALQAPDPDPAPPPAAAITAIIGVPVRPEQPRATSRATAQGRR